MGLGMLLGWGILLALAVSIVLSIGRNRKPFDSSCGALDILERAYARGNISREDFLQKRDDLSRGKKSEPSQGAQSEKETQ